MCPWNRIVPEAFFFFGWGGGGGVMNSKGSFCSLCPWHFMTNNVLLKKRNACFFSCVLWHVGSFDLSKNNIVKDFAASCSYS